MGNEPPVELSITLDRNGVAAPAQRVVTIASEVVGTCLQALANEDLSPPELQGGFVHYRFSGLEMSAEERRETYQNWILSKGFQDLARGVRETLEEALFYIAIHNLKQKRTTFGQFEADMASIRANVANLSFPKLLDDVNMGLSEPMAFEAEFLSLQRVRNCLEHRGGRVSNRDVDSGTGIMTLSFPRLRLFFRRGEEEVEVTKNSDKFCGESEGITVFLNRVTRSREYALDEPVVISADDFAEIAMACFMFASDIASKLPGETTELE
ncbi:MAG: hypothetical protein JNM75_04940 [Rhodospirillales bacterium]|nr:hypothetical protein [Rhodospirillales bacterium]